MLFFVSIWMGYFGGSIELGFHGGGRIPRHDALGKATRRKAVGLLLLLLGSVLLLLGQRWWWWSLLLIMIVAVERSGGGVTVASWRERGRRAQWLPHHVGSSFFFSVKFLILTLTFPHSHLLEHQEDVGRIHPRSPGHAKGVGNHE